jgi:putative ubiquitin-RnfH superfamily antitoxin RatB of RatAB toxin-antitoxin module
MRVETVLQDGTELHRQQHRVPAGMTIRQLLERAGLAEAAAQVAAGRLGLSCHGRRAWLDDPLTDGARVELVLPVRADARAERMRRVAAARARRRATAG